MIAPAYRIGGSMFANRRLLVNLVAMDLRESVVGSALGRLWLLIGPLVTVGIYIFIFAIVMQARLPGDMATRYDYTTYILAGLIPWLMSIEIMNKSCMAIISHSSLVKEVVFPIEVLPAKVVLSTLSVYIVFYGVFFAYAGVFRGGFQASHLFLPLLLFLQVMFLTGIALGFAAVTPFFRDWARLVGLSGMLLIYMAPIVYLAEWVPPIFKPILYVNPVSYMTWCFHDVLVYGFVDRPYAWIVFFALSLVTFTVGSWLFARLKPMFGNVL